ncbi:MAG: hypothetical protein KGH53_00970 [Candidatus Micrarchaeota archaeon]|nr:hypothetical protein [Candidatus Micrarchaeota archaeon]
MKGITLFAGLFTMLLMLGFVSAAYLQITGPITGTLYNNGSIYLGKVGPGESFYLLASATTANSSGKVINIGWNRFAAISLPAGWSAQASPLYENPMKLKITTAPNTRNGTYSMTLRAVNVGNYSGIGNLTFTALVNVTTNVFTPSVTPTKFNVGTGQPYNLQININNTGISDDPFVINAKGLAGWNVTDPVIALHSTTSSFVYPVFVNVPGVYNYNITVNSGTSTLISKSFPITMTAQASLLNDYGAVGQGVVLSPIIYEPTYAVMLLVNYILSHFNLA